MSIRMASEDGMTDYTDYEVILAVIETGIDVARRNPKQDALSQPMIISLGAFCRSCAGRAGT